MNRWCKRRGKLFKRIAMVFFLKIRLEERLKGRDVKIFTDSTGEKKMDKKIVTTFFLMIMNILKLWRTSTYLLRI